MYVLLGSKDFYPFIFSYFPPKSCWNRIRNTGIPLSWKFCQVTVYLLRLLFGSFPQSSIHTTHRTNIYSFKSLSSNSSNSKKTSLKPIALPFLSFYIIRNWCCVESVRKAVWCARGLDFEPWILTEAPV